MLEVNDFDAVRISLASPEQIRSWSHGCVTKPETINYRTLKPERDGLFCERIFGPTKDWECYCGKYKRVRYKGIICDKCGVEVARAKVRRERMGHIELASPVSHVWYVKGTPSRLGLLLDISPRNLERVLYFATYIVTHVDQEAKQKHIKHLRHDVDQTIEDAERQAKEQIDEINSETDAEIKRLQDPLQQERKRLDDELSSTADTIVNEARALEEWLTTHRGSAAQEEIVFQPSGRVIAAKDEAINDDKIVALKEHVQDWLDKKEKDVQEQQANLQARFEAERDQLVYVANQRIADISTKMTDETEGFRRELEEKLDAIESVEERQLLSETKYRELHEQYGKVFMAAMGAEAVYDIVSRVDLNQLASDLRADIQTTSGQRRKKAAKRLRVVEALRKSGNRPEWMIFTALPVIPPDLRPMVQLDGGRFATSDLNDLYRRVINRNNRLRRLLDLGAPEIIIRNEKRMLQEAVDALIDNGRRGRVVSGSGKHKLKSLSDMLKGKQGRFRQNLLGKRVDYSGRSVIVVGPELKLNQCGLPKKMALELFKPFVMRRLVERGYAHNIKSAKRIVERVRPEVWDVLEEVIKDYLVLLNRAPTLHRLGIQAFEAVLIEGSAIQIHPLVTTAYNADFDGDQMAVHVPLSAAAQAEARQRMLSTNNLLSPSNGEPVVTPTQDVVLGCFYLTTEVPGAKGEGKVFSSEEEAILSYNLDVVDLRAPVRVHVSTDGENPELIDTTIGRLIFNQSLPKQLRFKYQIIDKKNLKDLIARCYRLLGPQKTAAVADAIKRVGFRYATKGGLTISVEDIEVPKAKARILGEADARVGEIERQFRRGLITEDERYRETIEAWTQATEDVTEAVQKELNKRGAIFMMAASGARGNIQQIRQMAGMRGLMADPSGRIIDLPIRSNFREGLSVLEYFISTHGARKGLADTALRTADSGYLTRRLVDVAQDVIITGDDCGTEDGMWIAEAEGEEMPVPFRDRLLGRLAADPIEEPNTGGIIVDRNQEIDEARLDQILASGVKAVRVRSPLLCEAQHGVCRHCYGRNLASGRMVDIGEAVGIIAAQSIGEPGTQLTMRTFHTGGVAGEDITSGLPRVEELFEARVPKGLAVLSEIEGTVEIIREEDIRKLKVVYVETFPEEYPVPPGYEVVARDGTMVQEGDVLARPIIEGDYADMTARVGGRVSVDGNMIAVIDEQREEREYVVPYTAHLKVESGQHVYAGQQLTEGSVNPQDILQIQGRQAVQRYLVDEVQKVYRSQGVNTNDKHIEIIVRKMLSKVSIDSPGDTHFLPGELIDRFNYEEVNARVLAEGGEPATAQTVLLGVTKASLNTSSFLSAASFQETTRVLTEAAINGSVDYLRGLKENVIIGKLIPAGSGVAKKSKVAKEAASRTAPEIPLPYPSEEVVTAVGTGILADQEPNGHEESETGQGAVAEAAGAPEGDEIAPGTLPPAVAGEVGNAAQSKGEDGEPELDASVSLPTQQNQLGDEGVVGSTGVDHGKEEEGL